MKVFRAPLAVGGCVASGLVVLAVACASSGNGGGYSLDASTETGGFLHPDTGGSAKKDADPGSGTGISILGDGGGGSDGDDGTDSGVDTGTGTGTGTGAGTGTGTGTASSTASAPGTGTGTSTGTTPASSSSSSQKAPVDAGSCYKPPTALHPETQAGVYCPFSGADGGDNVTCSAGEHCCEPPESANKVSTCEPAVTTCPVASSTDWQCEGAPDCASESGTVCCGTGTIEQQAPQPDCGDGGYAAFSYVSGFKGSACASTCSGTGVFRICSKDSECPGGAAGSCVPIEPKGGGIGYCA
jgi:hypothetical protein